MTTNHWDIEVTDTFAGEANYSWVKRFEMEAKPGESNLAVVRRAKAIAGMNGERCKTDNYGDSFRLDVVGSCVVMFIQFRY